MGLVKSKEKFVEKRGFREFNEARECFENPSCSEEDRLLALEYIINHKEIYYVLRMLTKLFKKNDIKDHVYIDFAFNNFGIKPKRDIDFEELFKCLKSENAYLRNAAISFLQTYDKEAKPFIEKLLLDKDRDVRIFAINILGDVKYEDSAELLRMFILQEKDINALMTAIDYMGEIGDKSDIPLLEAIKNEHKDEPYITFGIDLAIQRIKS